jgi:plastocyanin
MNHLLLSFLLVATAVGASGAPAVQIKNDSFQPTSLTVVAGQTVTFSNLDDDAHTVTAADGSFDSKGLDSGGVWRHVFATPGTYRYFCELHPFMKATIVVKAAQ